LQVSGEYKLELHNIESRSRFFAANGSPKRGLERGNLMSTERILAASSWLVLTIMFTLHGDFVRAEGGEQPPAQYVSLPGNSVLREQARVSTGGGTRDFPSFDQQVARGAISLRTGAPTACLPGSLRLVVADVAARFGSVSLQSTHRTRAHNGRAGGARHSLHLSCRAIDLRVRTRSRGLVAYLRSRPEVGGLKIYRSGIIHIDNGERRSW
jgi:hypothetical protein